MTKELSETRKADRAKMAAELVRVVEEAGGTATIRDCKTHIWPDGSRPLPEDRDRLEISIKAPGGGCVGVDFDRRSCQPNVFVLSWHINLDSDDRFNPAWWDSINTVHYSKATVVAYGFDDLLMHIATDVRACASGEAYSEDLKAKFIAKDGTAAERSARFAAWRDELAASKAA